MPQIPGIHSQKDFFIDAEWTNEADSRNFPRGMDFRLPYKKGSKGVAVLAIKRFLGLDVLSGDFFDEVTKATLIAWQQEHTNSIMEVAGWSSTSQYRAELGTVNGATWALMIAAGNPNPANNPYMQEYFSSISVAVPGGGVPMYMAVQEVYKELENNRAALKDGEGAYPMRTLQDNIEARSDEPTDPYLDGDYYYYTYHSQATRSQVNRDNPGSYEDFIRLNSEIALRQGVKTILEYKNKPLEWVVNAEREDDIRIFGEILRFNNRKMSADPATVGELGRLRRRDFTRDLDVVQADADNWDYTKDMPGPDQPHIIESGAAELRRQIDAQEAREVPVVGQDTGIEVNNAITSFGDVRHLFTVNEIPVLEALGVVSPEGYESKVDVLFGQPLHEGAEARFASIHKVHSPTTRPGSRFKFTIRLKRTFVDSVPRDLTGQQVIEENLESIETVVETVQEVYEVASKVSDYLNRKNVHEVIDDARKAAGNYVNKFYRQGELTDRAKDAISNQLELSTGIVGLFGASEQQKKAFEASIAANHVGVESMPAARDYPSSVRFQAAGIKVAGFLRQLRRRMQQASRPPSFKPNINLNSEAGKLQAAMLALAALIEGSTGAGLSGKFRIGFDVVRRRQTITIRNPNGTPVLVQKIRDGKKELVPLKKTEVVTKGMYIYAIGTPDKGITLDGPALLTINYTFGPRTIGYIYNIMNMAKDVENPFCDLNQRVAGVQYITRYTYPSPTVLAAGAMLGGDTFSINAFFAGPIKDATDKIKEDISVLAKDPKAALWKDGVYEIERGKTYNILPTVPKEMLCTLDQLYIELLKKFDLRTLFCNFIECVPEIPFPTGFEDMSFDIPDLPDLPSFDPLKFIVPYLEALLLDIIIAILCALARYFLSLLQIPNCQDTILFAARKYNYYFGDNNQADTVAKATQALSAMNISTDSLSDVADSLDDIANSLAPYEFVSLLKGNADTQTLKIADRVLRVRADSMSERLGDLSEISEFFELLGAFVDDEVATRIENYPNVVLGEIACSDDLISPTPDMLKRARSDVGSTPDEGMLYTPPARSLRQKLLDAKATDAEINKALIDAAKNREAFKKLMSPGEGGLLKLPPPGCPANGGLPGPYDNDFFRGLSKNAIDIIFNDIKIFFNNDMRAYVPTFFGPHARPLTPNDPEYDHVAMAEYDFVMRQVEYILTLSQSDDEEIQELSSQLWLRIMKPGTIVNEPGTIKAMVAKAGDARLLRVIPREKEKDQRKHGNQTAADKFGDALTPSTSIFGGGNARISDDVDFLFHLGDNDSGPDKNTLNTLGVPSLANFVMNPGSPIVLPNTAIKPADDPQRANVALQATAQEKGAEVPSVVKYEVYDMTKKSDQDELARVLMRPLDSFKSEVTILPKIRRILLDQTNFKAETSNSPYYHLDADFLLSAISQESGGTRDRYGILGSRNAGVNLLSTIFGVLPAQLSEYMNRSVFNNSGGVFHYYWNLLMSLWHQSTSTSQVSARFPAPDIMTTMLLDGEGNPAGRETIYDVLSDIMELPMAPTSNPETIPNILHINDLRNDTDPERMQAVPGEPPPSRRDSISEQYEDYEEFFTRNANNLDIVLQKLTREDFRKIVLAQFARNCFLKFVSVLDNLQESIINGTVRPGTGNRQETGFEAWWTSQNEPRTPGGNLRSLYRYYPPPNTSRQDVEDYTQIKMPESWKDFFYSVSQNIGRQLIMRTKEHFKISIGGMIEKAKHFAEKSQINLAELPYSGPKEKIRDCYIVSRWGSSPYYRIGNSNNSMYVIRHEVFTEEIKGEFKIKRIEALDFKSEPPSDTQIEQASYAENEGVLLRPGAYADILFQNSKAIYDDIKTKRILNTRSDAHIDANFDRKYQNVFNESASKHAWSFLTKRDEQTLQDSVYAKTVDRFMDKIAYEISNSKYFNVDEMNALGNRITNVRKKVYFLKNRRMLNIEYNTELFRRGLTKANDLGELVHHTSAYIPTDGQFSDESSPGNPIIDVSDPLRTTARTLANLYNEQINNIKDLPAFANLNNLPNNEGFYLAGPKAIGLANISQGPGSYIPSDITYEGKYLEYDPLEISDYQYREAIRRGKFTANDFATCMIENKPVIDFEKVKDEALSTFVNSLCREEYDPTKRDFTKPGPLELETQGQLVILYMKTFIYEFLFNGILMFGNMSAKGLFDSEFIKSYIVDNILTTIAKDFQEDRGFKISFIEKLKYMLNEKDDMEAVRKIVQSITTDVLEEVSNAAIEIFQPDFASFKEQFFNELASDFLDGGRYYREPLYAKRSARGRFVQDELNVDFNYLLERNGGRFVNQESIPITYKNHPAESIFNLPSSYTPIGEEGVDFSENDGESDIRNRDLNLSQGVLDQLINNNSTVKRTFRAQTARAAASDLPIAGFGDISAILNLEDPNGNPRHKYNTAASLVRGGFYLEKYFKLSGIPEILNMLISPPTHNAQGHRILAQNGEPYEPTPGFFVTPHVLPSVLNDLEGSFHQPASTIHGDGTTNGGTEEEGGDANKPFMSAAVTDAAGDIKAFSTYESQNSNSADTLKTKLPRQIVHGFGDEILHPIYTFFYIEYWSPADITKLWNFVSETENENAIDALVNSLTDAQIGIRLMQVMPESTDLKSNTKTIFGDESTPRRLDLRIRTEGVDTSRVNDLNFINRRQDISSLKPQSEFLYPYATTGLLASTINDNASTSGRFVETFKSDVSQFINNVDLFSLAYSFSGDKDGNILSEDTSGTKQAKSNIYRRTSFKLCSINRIHKCGAMIWSPGGKTERYPLRLRDLNVFENSTNQLDKYNKELSQFRAAYSAYYNSVVEGPIRVIEASIVALEQLLFPQPAEGQENDEAPERDFSNIRGLFLQNLLTPNQFATNADDPAKLACGFYSQNMFSITLENISRDEEKLKRVQEFRGTKPLGQIVLLLNQENNESSRSNRRIVDNLSLSRKKIKFVVPVSEYIAGTINLNPQLENCPILTPTGKLDANKIEKMAEKYNNILLKNMLGLGKERKTVNNTIVRKMEHDPDEDIKYLFDFVFPLDRYQDLFFIHNETLVREAIQIEDSGYLEPTRGAIRRQYRILENVPGKDKASENLTFSQEEFAEILRNAEDGKGPHGGEGPDLLKDIGAAIIRIAYMTPISIVRGLSIMLDPAYAQMKTVMETDPCKLRKGLLWGSVGVGGVYPAQLQEGSRVDGGKGPNCNNKFHPMPWAPIPDVLLSVKDIVKGLTMFMGFPPFVYPPLIIKGASRLANVLMHIKGGITFSSTQSYGSILGPAGAIALSLPEIPGEVHKERHRDAGCAEQGDPCADAIPQPETMDICDMVKSDLRSRQEEMMASSQSGGQIIEEDNN